MKPDATVIPSDALAVVYQLAELYPALSQHLGGPHRLRLVIDASVVLADIRWLAGRRRTPGARTNLQELIAAGTIVPYAPEALRDEVLKEIPSIAAELALGEELLIAAWGDYEKQIHFDCPGGPLQPQTASNVRDPKDLPYVLLATQINAHAVYTRDKDISAMGARTVSAEIMVSLRDYARGASVEMTLKIGGSVVTLAGVKAIRGLIALIHSGIKWMRSLPRGVQLTMLVVGICLLLHPRVRAAVLRCVQELGSSAADTLTAITPLLGNLLQLMSDGQRNREQAWKAVATCLPPGARAPLRTYIRAVCVVERRPLAVVEIARRVRLAGYISRARNFDACVRRVLREDSNYSSTSDGLWMLAATP